MEVTAAATLYLRAMNCASSGTKPTILAETIVQILVGEMFPTVECEIAGTRDCRGQHAASDKQFIRLDIEYKCNVISIYSLHDSRRFF
jgi:hypothetical protein